MQLNFDKFNFQVKSENNKNFIFDKVRRKYVSLTPEEWVRQHIVHQLIENGFAQGRISIERNLPNSKKRYDIVYYDSKGVPILLVECKAPSVAITQKTIDQIAGYLVLQSVPYVLLSNGHDHYFISRKMDAVQIDQDFPNISKLSD